MKKCFLFLTFSLIISSELFSFEKPIAIYSSYIKNVCSVTLFLFNDNKYCLNTEEYLINIDFIGAGRVLSFGYYTSNSNEIILTDIVSNYSHKLLRFFNNDYIFVQSFNCLLGMHMVFNNEKYARYQEKNDNTHTDINYFLQHYNTTDKNKYANPDRCRYCNFGSNEEMLLAPAVYISNFLICILPDKTYELYYLDEALLSKGKWKKDGKFIDLIDNNNQFVFKAECYERYLLLLNFPGSMYYDLSNRENKQYCTVIPKYLYPFKKKIDLTSLTPYYHAMEDEVTDIRMVAEVMPEFPGGIDSLKSFIKKNTIIPDGYNSTTGKSFLFVGFVVEKDGSITNEKILRGISKECDEEAIRIVKAMPKWTPGKTKGALVRVQYSFKIDFSNL